ncbi:LacI family transcriptional regulator [Capsulimonas corticalis]|uniref:LacI family transcriptional regulator n=1 Tax=Capsulimonas corticalis TaxID=2219043 RepID=A0A402D1D4_9BACT|nr:LacI family DNA-binding transcriptional regulator [Capsulimonas corticalis]BDI31644.1 LacI family transcriptional regulator [Capsulimonas corticalis]
MTISIREVAARAKVSRATVSRVLNNVDVPISAETRQLVRHVAAEMGYQPNRAARALATGRTQTIALWTSNLRSAYYGEVIYYTHEEIVRHEYELFVSAAGMGPGELVDTNQLASWPVDGVLAVDVPRGKLLGLSNSLIENKAFVNIGAYVLEDADFVQVDFQEKAAEAVLHLAETGCKRIAYLVPDWFEWFEESADARLTGYRLAMAKLGREPEYIVTDSELREAATSALASYAGAHGCPDGLFCYNDELAIGAYPALRELGLSIPDDVAVVGCDGIKDTSYLYPALTTIVQPLEQMCATAWAFLKRRIDDPTVSLQQQILQPRLEIRGSSKR